MESSDCVFQAITDRNSAKDQSVNEPLGVRGDHEEESNVLKRDTASSEREPVKRTEVVKTEPIVVEYLVEWNKDLCLWQMVEREHSIQNSTAILDMSCSLAPRTQSNSNRAGMFTTVC